MANIYYLNAPPNPFWDFVSDLEDHPFFRGPPPQSRRRGQPSSTPPPNPTQESTTSGNATQPSPEMSEKVRGKQATVEDPPEVDPSTIVPETKKGEDKPETPEPHCWRGRNGRSCRGGRGRPDRAGPPPFPFGGHPFFARAPWEHHGPPHHGRRGPPGPPGPHDETRSNPHGPPLGRHGPHGHHGPHGPHGPHRRPSPPRQPRQNFDLGEFLNDLGSKLGLDLNRAAEGLGLASDRFTAGKTSEHVDFEPRTDIFENEDLYTIHLSLAGAKKSDIGVDYDGEHSVLRITGVVHRPDVDEEMLKQLVVDGRKRENGVFEKAIRLGTKRDPASVDVAAISAKMIDGVLIIRVPKLAKIHHKREIPVNSEILNEAKADYDDEYSEKPAFFDADEVASVADTDGAEATKREEIDLLDMTERESEKLEKAHQNVMPVKSEAGHFKTTIDNEPLPVYTQDAEEEEEEWEKFSNASAEGEYVKINVD